MQQFSGIAVEYATHKTIVMDFDFANDFGLDEEQSFIKYLDFDLKGIPSGIELYELPNLEDALKEFPIIGNIQGTLILSQEMEDSGYNTYTLCDDISADLEFIMSALMQSEQLDIGYGLQYNFFDIDHIQINSEYKNTALLEKIVICLPRLIFEVANVFPDILSYYPQPTSNNWVSVTEHEQAVMDHVVLQAGEILNPTTANPDVQKNDKIVRITTPYNISEDDFNRIFGRRHSGSSYPEHLKDQKLLSHLHKLGFAEIEDTRIFHKYTREL